MPEVPFNLIHEDWLPVRRADGTRLRVAPWRIVEGWSDNPIVAVDWPRPDFNGATLEFLIGLLATAFAPKDRKEWLARWNRPPAPEELHEAFERVAFAFDLDGDGPCFMQEFGNFVSPSDRDIASLMVDQPGEKSIERHADHFVKHGAISAISRASAAIALYTVQAYSPAGGRGFLTSMRGGGPLTTLVVADRSDGAAGLWDWLWPNVPDATWPDWTNEPAKVFPWLARTRSSREFTVTTPEHGHFLQAFWGMPRRVHLVFNPSGNRACDLEGPPDDKVAVGWTTLQHGVSYEGWVHPLSPYTKTEAAEPPNPTKGNPGGVTYRHWLGLVQEDAENGRQPAACVKRFREDRAESAEIAGVRLVAFGYDMDKMKARCWYQAEIPVPSVAADRRQNFETLAAQAVRAANEAEGFTRSAVKRASFARPTDVSGDFSAFADRFSKDTEAGFSRLLNAFARHDGDDARLREEWLATLRRAALAIFDDAVPSEGIEEGAWRRVVEARKNLVAQLNGKKIRIALGLPPPPG